MFLFLLLLSFAFTHDCPYISIFYKIKDEDFDWCCFIPELEENKLLIQSEFRNFMSLNNNPKEFFVVWVPNPNLSNQFIFPIQLNISDSCLITSGRIDQILWEATDQRVYFSWGYDCNDNLRLTSVNFDDQIVDSWTLTYFFIFCVIIYIIFYKLFEICVKYQ